MDLVTKSSTPEQSVSHDPDIKKRVFLKDGDVPGILQWATTTIGPGMTVSDHKHDDAREIFQVVEGSLEATVNGNQYALHEGDLLVVDPGEQHSFGNGGSQICIIIYTLMLAT
jgi:quercetin dioxygenase-like cupin family protein